jgi:SAM-dependent methyltransferase
METPEVNSLYQDSAYYNLIFCQRTVDLPWYERVCSTSTAPILELGVGTGRVTFHLARLGHQMVGIDLSESMLQAFEIQRQKEEKQVQDRVRTHQEHGAKFRWSEQFERILYPFNGLAHYHSNEQLKELFENVRRHLSPQGLFAFDVLSPNPQLLAGFHSSVPWFRHPESGLTCRANEDISFDMISQIMTIQTHIRTMEGEESHSTLELQLRQFFPQETLLLLEKFGFRLVEQKALGDTIAYLCTPELGPMINPFYRSASHCCR